MPGDFAGYVAALCVAARHCAASCVALTGEHRRDADATMLMPRRRLAVIRQLAYLIGMSLLDISATPPVPRGRREMLLMPALLAVMGMLIALVAATIGQDYRRARDTLQMNYDVLYWEQCRNTPMPSAGARPADVIAQDEQYVEKYRARLAYPPWDYGYAKYGRQFTAWDGYRYEEIIEKGYIYHQPDSSPDDKQTSALEVGEAERRVKNVSWFPLYPLIAGIVGKILHIRAVYSLTIVSWSCTLAAAVLLFVFARRHFLSRADVQSRRAKMDLAAGTPVPVHDLAALLTVLLLLFGPCSIFLYANFTESLFLVLLAGFLLCLQRGNWWRAAAIAALASACRSQGVLFGPILAVVFLLRASSQGAPSDDSVPPFVQLGFVLHQSGSSAT